VSVIIDHQPVSFPAGTRTAEGVVTGGQTIWAHLARQTTATPTFWAPGVSMELQIEVSLDNGGTWQLAGVTSAPGGIIPGKGGVGEAVETGVLCAFPPAANRARVTLIITGGTLVSQLTLETF
jgi:hypothetical protein